MTIVRIGRPAAGDASGLDVRDFGAAGDGVADDTNALLAAATAAGQVSAAGGTGNIVLLGRGRFRITNTLPLANNSVVLRGAGRNACQIIADAAFPTGTPLVTLGPPTGTVFDTRLEDLTVHCNGVVGSIGVRTTCAQEASGLIGVRVRDYRDAGFVAQAPASGAAPAMVVVDGCEFWGHTLGTNRAISFDQVNKAEPCFVRDTTVLGYNTSTGPHTTGLYVNNSTVHVAGLYVERYLDGIYATNGSYVQVHGIHGANGPGGSPTTALVHAGPDTGTSMEVTSVYNGGARAVWFESTGHLDTVSWVGRASLNTRVDSQLTVPGAEFIVGRYAVPPTGQTNTAVALNSLRAYPVQIRRRTTLDRIGISVTTGQASGVVRLGAFRDDGSGRPGALIADFGTVDASATATPTITINQTLEPGRVWLAGVSQGSASPPTVQVNNGALPGITAASISEAAANLNGYEMTGVTGALPSAFTVGAAIAASHRVLVRVSALP